MALIKANPGLASPRPMFTYLALHEGTGRGYFRSLCLLIPGYLESALDRRLLFPMCLRRVALATPNLHGVTLCWWRRPAPRNVSQEVLAEMT